MKPKLKLYLKLSLFTLWSPALVTLAAQPAVAARGPVVAQEGTASLRADEIGVLGEGDEVTLRDFDLEELNAKVFQIGEDGTIGLPMVGRVKVSGLTVAEFEREINDKLRVYVKEPKTTVASVQYRSRPVSVLGAVNTPGVYQVTGPRTLVQMLSLAGGLRTDAGSWLIVTRKDPHKTAEPPQPNAVFTAGVTEIRIPTTGLLNGTDPRAGMSILGNDVISVGKGEFIYVMGDVKKSGGFPLGEHERLSLVKALSLAEGFQMTASLSHSRILREANGQLTETPVDIGRILEGKDADVMLQPQDVLYVPTSMGKRIAMRSIEAAVQAGIGVAIWH